MNDYHVVLDAGANHASGRSEDQGNSWHLETLTVETDVFIPPPCRAHNQWKPTTASIPPVSGTSLHR